MWKPLLVREVTVVERHREQGLLVHMHANGTSNTTQLEREREEGD
jgi:hypothetical protein